MNKEKFKATWSALMKSNGSVVVVFVLLFAFLSIFTPNFLKTNNLLLLMKQAVSTAILAYGMAFCLITGELDLSLGATVAMSGVGAALLMKHGMGFYPAFVIMFLVCLVIGFINGFLVANTPIPSFIVTLAMSKVIRGAAYIISGGLPISNTNEDFYNFANHSIFGILTNSVIWMVALMVILSVILKKTVFGQHMLATGGNKTAAVYTGIDVKKVKIIVYIIAAAMACIAGMLVSSRVTQGSPMFGEGYETNAVAAAVLGGVSFTGGQGSIIGCFLGAMLLALITNGLYMLSVSTYMQMVIEGLLILLAVYFDMSRRAKES